MVVSDDPNALLPITNVELGGSQMTPNFNTITTSVVDLYNIVLRLYNMDACRRVEYSCEMPLELSTDSSRTDLT